MATVNSGMAPPTATVALQRQEYDTRSILFLLDPKDSLTSSYIEVQTDWICAMQEPPRRNSTTRPSVKLPGA
jgi:hypothetical protein